MVNASPSAVVSRPHVGGCVVLLRFCRTRRDVRQARWPLYSPMYAVLFCMRWFVVGVGVCALCGTMFTWEVLLAWRSVYIL